MEFTGERFVPGVLGKIELEHLHRYLLATQVVSGKRVLDIASGEGYGSVMLARTAYKVIGVDSSQEAISHAQARYRAQNLEFRLGSCSAIPVADASIDVVVTFETIEHHDEHEAMMGEIKRVLHPMGVLIISSPDKLEYSDKPGYSNPYHVKELYRDEFKNLLELNFRNHSIYGQRVIYGSAILCEDRISPIESYELADATAVPGVPHAVYVVAVASDADLPFLSSGILDQPVNEMELMQDWVHGVTERDGQIASLTSVVAERDGRIDSLRRILTERDDQVGRLIQIVAERDDRVGSLTHGMAERDGRIASLTQIVTERDGQIGSLAQIVSERDDRIGKLKQIVGERGGQIDNLTQIVSERDGQIGSLTRIVGERDDRIDNLTQIVSERDDRIDNLTQIVSERDDRIDNLTQIVSERDGQIGSLTRIVGERDDRIDSLTQTLVERDDRIAILAQIVGERDGQIGDLAHILAERDDRLRSLVQAVTERDGRIASFMQAVAEHERQIARLNQAVAGRDTTIHALRRSHSWRVTAPLRFLGRLARATARPLLRTMYAKSSRLAPSSRVFLQVIWWTITFRLRARLAALKHLQRDAKILAESGLFNATWYLARNPDVAAARIDPLLHYLQYGSHEGREPNPRFDTASYLTKNPNVVATGINPLVHWLQHVAAEGLVPYPLFDSVWYGARHPERKLQQRFDDTAVETELRHLDTLAKRCATLCGPQGQDPEVSVVIPVHNQLPYTMQAIGAVLSSGPKRSFELLVVDDCSTDLTARSLSLLSWLTLISQRENSGFVSSCNLGAEQARGRYLLFLNNDTHVLSGWLDELRDTFEDNPRCGLAGSQLIFPDGSLQEAGGIVWRDGSAWNYGRGQDRLLPEFNYLREVDYCSGASIMIPRDLFCELGKFDSIYAPAYCEDVDLAFKVRKAGWSVLYQPFSKVVHFEGVSSGTDPTNGVKAYQVINSKKLFARWKDFLASHRNSGIEPALERDRGFRGRVLFVDALTPTPDQDSGSLVADKWLQILQSLGFKVTFIPQSDFAYSKGYTERLQRRGIECVYGPHVPSMTSYIEEFGKSLDAAVVFRYEVAKVVYPLLRQHAPQVKTLFHAVDLHYLRQERLATLENSMEKRLESLQVKFEEMSVIAQSDLVCVHSPVERAEIRRELPDIRVRISPLILDIPGRRKNFKQRANICFIGGYRHPPNVDAVLYFVKSVFALIQREFPEVKFKIVGNEAPAELCALTSNNVELIGFVEDLSVILDNIRVTVAPLRYGAGMKGKVGMSLSYGVPVVGTSVAFEGMGLRHEGEVLLGDTIEELAQAVCRLYTDEELWYRLSERGLAHVTGEYSVSVNREAINGYLKELGVYSGRRSESRAGEGLPREEQDAALNP